MFDFVKEFTKPPIANIKVAPIDLEDSPPIRTESNWELYEDLKQEKGDLLEGERKRDSPLISNEARTLATDFSADLQRHYDEILCFNKENLDHWTQSKSFENHVSKNKIEDLIKRYPKIYRRRLWNEIFSCGPIEDLIKDPTVDEILILGHNNISYERSGQLKVHQDKFLSETSFLRFFDIIARDFFKSISFENPTGNGFWNDFRVHIIGPPLADQIQVSMRRIGGSKIKSLKQLLERDYLNQDAYDLLIRGLQGKKNILICGATSSGKTTLIQCLINECVNDRLILLEDSKELEVPNTLSTSLVCPTRTEQYCLNFTMKDLVKESLRMRPDRIVLGEARSDEAKDFIQALSTGHRGCIASIHSSCARYALIRFECLISQGAPTWSEQVIKQLIHSGIDWIVYVEKNKDGKRYLKTLSEITSLEPTGFLLQDLVSR